MTLPNDVARCEGDGYQEEDDRWEWREGCADCLRRTSPGGRSIIEPPPIIAFECEYRIAPEGCITQPLPAAALTSAPSAGDPPAPLA